MSQGNGHQSGVNAAAQGKPMPTSNNYYVQQNIQRGYLAGGKK